MAAIRAVFTALFDAVDVAGDFDEGKWEDLIAALNATGRLVFGWPHLVSREEDLLGAIDAMTDDFQATKDAIEQTTKEARIVMHELHEALGPTPPDEPQTEPSAPEPTNSPVPRAGDTHENASTVAPPANDPIYAQVHTSSPLAKAVAAPSRVDRAPEEAVAQPARVDDGKVRSFTTGAPRQGPRYDVEKMYAAIRATESLGDAAVELGIGKTTLLSRLDNLEGHRELPPDIQARRPRAGGPDESLSFDERRKESAKEASERTWRERHPASA
jgi:hypothetical protein